MEPAVVVDLTIETRSDGADDAAVSTDAAADGVAEAACTEPTVSDRAGTHAQPTELLASRSPDDDDAPVVQFAASKVALLLGLHEFGDVTEALLEYVYQDREELLESDARVLGLRVVSKDEELDELVAKTGVGLASQFQEILQWTRERKNPVTQDAAAELLKSVDGLVTQARGKRTLQTEEAQEVKRQLSERIRLSYGCRNEDLALKTYEKQTGSTVRMNNQEFYFLHFPRLDHAATVTTTVPVDYLAVEKAVETHVVSKRRQRRGRGKKAERDARVPRDEETALEDEFRAAEEEHCGGSRGLKRSPYFTICGMVDGVADALEIADDDDWRLVPILLEVKNRMRAFRVPPPLYDYIQMAIYLKMLSLHAGDLIQCLHADRAQIHVTRVSLDEYPLRCTAATQASARQAQKGSVGGGGGLWASVILPRLYKIVQTVEELRRHDLLRLSFLNGSESERIAILRRECDFL